MPAAKKAPPKKPGRKPKPKVATVRQSKWPLDAEGYSTNPKAIARRQYRQRKATGLTKPKSRTPPYALPVAAKMRAAGASYREIGRALGVDHSWLAKMLKRQS